MPEDIKSVLADRNKTHGDFSSFAELESTLLNVINCELDKNGKLLRPVQQSALRMIVHKISRIVNGDPYHEDHWQDIIGYATLSLKNLEPPVSVHTAMRAGGNMISYKLLLERVLTTGDDFEDRSGKGSLVRFGETAHFDLSKSFPVLDLRSVNYKAAFGELAGFIKGATTNEEFKQLGCNYWSAYGEQLGPIYGYQWRHWGGDQLLDLVENIKSNPFSRRHILSTWNVTELEYMVLPPCHLLAQYHVTKNGELDCCVYMRSVDLAIGMPYDVIVYALLQHLIARDAGLKARNLTFFLGNAHIYKPHIEGVSEMLKRDLKDTAQLVFINRYTKTGEPPVGPLNFEPTDVVLTSYNPGEPIKLELFK